MAKFHFPKLPLAQAEIQRMTAFSPHESFFRSKSRQGRFQALKQCAIGVVRYPLETPFWMMVNTALLMKKLGQLIFNTAALASLSKKRRANVKVYAIQALDYACLLPLIPLMRACSVMRSLAAASIHPGLYYRRPSRCTKDQQAHYFQKQADELFQKLFHKDGLSKEQKQDIWSLKKQMKRCIHKAAAYERKILIAQACALAVKGLDGKMDPEQLKRFKAFLDGEEVKAA